MFIRSIFINNIRSISSLKWQTPGGERKSWNVILGDNGSGKSTLLRCAALALIGEHEAAAARQDWTTWRRYSTARGKIVVDVVSDAGHDSRDQSGSTAGI